MQACAKGMQVPTFNLFGLARQWVGIGIRIRIIESWVWVSLNHTLLPCWYLGHGELALAAPCISKWLHDCGEFAINAQTNPNRISMQWYRVVLCQHCMTESVSSHFIQTLVLQWRWTMKSSIQLVAIESNKVWRVHARRQQCPVWMVHCCKPFGWSGLYCIQTFSESYWNI